MDKQTLSNYGWLVIVTLILAVMLALATPFGTYVGDAVVSVANGFVGSSNQAIDEDNISNLQNKWDEKLNSNIGSSTPNSALNPSGIIPDGALYYVGVLPDGVSKDGSDNYNDGDAGDYTGATAILTAGDKFPTVTYGDVYVFGDYEYRFGRGYCCCCSWFCCNETEGWGVRALDTSKTEYEAVLERINGEPITAMTDTFFACDNITSTITVPSTVKSAFCMMDNCTEDITIKMPCTLEGQDIVNQNVRIEYYHIDGCNHFPSVIIPEGATYTQSNGTTLNAGDSFPIIEDGDIYTYGDYEYCYQNTWCTDCERWSSKCGCEYKTTGWSVHVIDTGKDIYGIVLPTINNQPITDMTETFKYCEYLMITPTIPSSVTNMENTFNGCTSLTTAPEIPSSVTNMKNTFAGCDSLTTAPAIPSSVTNMENTFNGCTSLTTAPEIPSGVVYMAGTFKNCTSLVGTISINANPQTWTQCLRNTQITAIIGKTTKANDIMLTITSAANNPTA